LEKFTISKFILQAEEVTDKPQGVTTAETSIQIKITDINDETPKFNLASFTGKILENSQPGSLVTFIPANTEMSVTDKDQGNNGKFKLQIKKDGNAYGTFDVVPSIVYGSQQNVQIKVKNSTELDYEKVKELTFDVSLCQLIMQLQLLIHNCIRAVKSRAVVRSMFEINISACHL
jgi:hypothetical protein